MISVVIPTLNAAPTLGRTLVSLLQANSAGALRELIISDGGSSDETCALAEAAGARLIGGLPGRGPQLHAGAMAARGDWLLFLHADTSLAPAWLEHARRHMAESFGRRAAVFRLRFDDDRVKARLVAAGANLRARLFALPYGDQGLLISRRHYEALGGFQPLPMFEDVDLVRRIVRDGGRQAIAYLPVDAVTSAARYVEEGYAARVLRNARSLARFFRGDDVGEIVEFYERQKASARRAGKAAGRRKREDAPGA